jgi:hypothetical protein
MSAFEDYLQLGLALTPLRPGTKEPYQKGWQLPENAIRGVQNAYRLNESAGLLLAHCDPPLMTLDIDDFHAAASWFDEREVDLADLLQAEDAVQIVSGRPNHFKLLYRIDRPRLTRKFMQDGKTIFELRCATGNGGSVQDVLPPSIHPSTGKPYEWGGLGNPLDSPSAPEEILELWDNLNEDKRPQGVETDSAGTSSLDAIIDQTRIKEALQKIPPDIDYPDWLAVGQGINNTLPGERGFALWDTWSAKGEKYKPGECEKKWLTFTPGGGITKATVFDLAKNLGWVDPHRGSAPKDPSPTSANERTQPSSTAQIFEFPPLESLAMSRFQGKTAPTPEFLVPGLIPKAEFGILYGPSGSKKSMFMLQLMYGLAAGRPIADNEFWEPDQPISSLYISYEDPRERMWYRLNLLEAYHRDYHRERLPSFGTEADFYYLDGIGHREARWLDKDGKQQLFVDQLSEFLIKNQARGIKIIVIDTLRSSIACEEVNERYQEFATAARKLIRETGVTVIAVHHVSQMSLMSGARDIWAARGGMALTDASRFALGISGMTESEAKKCPEANDPGFNRNRYICLNVAKMTDGPPGDTCWLKQHLEGNPMLGVSHMSMHESLSDADLTQAILDHAAEELGQVITDNEKDLHSSTSFKDYLSKGPLRSETRKRVRATVDQLIDRKKLIEKELPSGHPARHGRRTTALTLGS